ncbi:MAG: DUF4065 domain-containing protein [Clostridiales Family XIII bacterium]|jgi:uncharacterized phage-associated protein|nr:DUF4065 domain-containing protein [Clostridiales Family XIII bacterium]
MNEDVNLNSAYKPLSAYFLADYIIEKHAKSIGPIEKLKLQKMLYYTQAYSLVNRGMPAFSDDIIAARRGPIVESVLNYYSAVCPGQKLIYEPVSELGFLAPENQALFKPVNIIPGFLLDIADKVIEAYASFTGEDISEKTHGEQPWMDATDNGVRFGDKITNESIKDFYAAHPQKILGC